MVGETLGHYEILEPLGQGGMGEVYRARDTNLDREVAIKVLPEDLAADPERLARLTREAKLLAQLNHPNIAGVHGLEDDGETRFIAMELVEGETLADRIARSGQIEVDEALDIARQIAEGLEAAHENGVIHRDLKPANVIVTEDGKAKVLDFGLAKASVSEGGDASDSLTHSPTATVGATEAGVLLGTAPYMSPEQAKGKVLDKRTDIWAWGCVVFEILTGKRPFQGENVTETLAAVIKEDPDWSRLPAETPPAVATALRRCLRKDPNRRLHDIADARIEIEEAVTEPFNTSAHTHVDGATVVRGRPGVLAIAAAIGLAVGAAIALIVSNRLAPAPGITDPIRSVIRLEEGWHLWGGEPNEAVLGGDRPSRAAITFAPDGSAIVYAASSGVEQALFLRPLDESEALRIGGTDGGAAPLFGPDGASLIFFANSAVMTVPIIGGTPRVVVETPASYPPAGMSWAGDGTVLVGTDQGIFRFPVGGGAPTRATEVRSVQGDLSHSSPTLLPDAETLLYTRRVLPYSRPSDIMVQGADGEPKILVANGADARYLPTGHLVFVREGTLIAVPFDPDTVELVGEEVRVVEDVMQARGSAYGDLETRVGQFAVSATGSLAYARGGVFPPLETSPVWVDREGQPTPMPIASGYYVFVRFSPDHQRLVLRALIGGEPELQVLHLASGATTVFEMPGRQYSPVWSPDGERVAFASDHDTGGPLNLYWSSSDGRDGPHRLTTSSENQVLSDWSSSGVLVFVQDGDIWVLDTETDIASPFLESEASEAWPTFSPDGDWIAYGSDEDGRLEVYVRPFPQGSPRYTVSAEGGHSPAWSPDGDELYYHDGNGPDGTIMVVAVDRSDGLSFGTPERLFDRRLPSGNPARLYDVAGDGRFVFVDEFGYPEQPVTEIHLVLNWFEELKRLVPTGR